jgi:hypothetical protein
MESIVTRKDFHTDRQYSDLSVVRTRSGAGVAMIQVFLQDHVVLCLDGEDYEYQADTLGRLLREAAQEPCSLPMGGGDVVALAAAQAGVGGEGA